MSQDTQDRVSPSTYDAYASIFEEVLANTPELITESQRLRYQVYCLERDGYENPKAFADQCEHDAYDDHAQHALLRHRASNLFVGTVRLIIKRAEDSVDRIPLSKICDENDIPLPSGFLTNTYGEISRFSISKTFRRRATDTAYSTSYSKEQMAADNTRLIPYMALGLIALINKISHHENNRHFCAIMEPALIRLLDRLGIHFAPVGPLIEHHGQRQVCFASMDQLLSAVKGENPDVWEIITDRGRYV